MQLQEYSGLKAKTIFVEKLEKMMSSKDTLNGKYYLINLLNYYVRDGSRVGFFDVNATFVQEHTR